MRIKATNTSRNPLPRYESEGAAGMDLRADLKDPLTLLPMARLAVPTGLSFEIPEGMELQIRPRSGLALKYGITVLNAPGTIDSDYRGEVKVILINLGNEPYRIEPGDRIAQMVLARHERITDITVVDALNETGRGTGGFGHSGNK